jgi:hypothetical protein
VTYRLAETHYNLHQPSALPLEAFKISMLILWKNFNSLMTLAAVIINVGKTGRTDVLGRTHYFVRKCSQMFDWSNEYK